LNVSSVIGFIALFGIALHVGRNNVAQSIAGTAQTTPLESHLNLSIQPVSSDRSSGSGLGCLFRPTFL
jgi:hypothetical protein